MGLGLADGLGVLLVIIVQGVLVGVGAGVVVKVVGVLGREVRGGGARLVAHDLDATRAEAVVEVRELVAVDVDVLEGDLDVVLAHRTALARAGNQALNHTGELIGKLDVVLALLCSHVCPFDAQTSQHYTQNCQSLEEEDSFLTSSFTLS